jgi:class 3 adenylate cyclase
VAGPQAETVTVLFTDVVGSTAFRGRVGDARADGRLLELERASRDVVAARGGAVVKGLGDGVMATFSSAASALDAAVALQEVAQYLYRMGGLQLRVGVSSGDMVREEADWHGIAAAEASRLCAEAAGGSVLASATTVLLARGRTQYEPQPVGEKHLRGFATPIEVFELRPPNDDAVPVALACAVPATMVGRSLEVAAGEQMLEALAAGASRSLFVVGEPGVGKSSLAGAIGQAAAAMGFVVLYGHCDRSIGHLLTTLGLLDEADAAYQSAAQLEPSCAFPALAVRTHYWHARMLLQRRSQGDHEYASELLHGVMRITAELGMHRLNQQAAEAALLLPSSSA